MYTKRMRLGDKLYRNIDIVNAAAYPDVFGVEVELEGKAIGSPPLEVQQWWSLITDGSLRKLHAGDQAWEYVFTKPLDLNQTQKAIELLFEYLNTPPAKVYDSYRTSIHVHVNYAQETFRTIYCAMVLSIILDELLVSQNGDHRIGNNFCLRAKDALGQVISIVKSIQAGSEFFGLHANHRYGSINFSSLTKFGSIEYRSLECTTHEGRLMHWINTLQRIKEKARSYTDPSEIIQQFSMFQPTEFLQDVLGPYAVKYLKVEGYPEMLRNGMRIAQDLAFCSQWLEHVPKPRRDDW